MAFMRFGGFMRCSMRNVLNPKRIRSGFKTKPLEAISMKQSRKVERMSMRLCGATQRDTLYKLLKMQLFTFKESMFSFFGVFQSEILWDVHLQAFDQTACATLNTTFHSFLAFDWKVAVAKAFAVGGKPVSNKVWNFMKHFKQYSFAYIQSLTNNRRRFSIRWFLLLLPELGFVVRSKLSWRGTWWEAGWFCTVVGIFLRHFGRHFAPELVAVFPVPRWV